MNAQQAHDKARDAYDRLRAADSKLEDLGGEISSTEREIASLAEVLLGMRAHWQRLADRAVKLRADYEAAANAWAASKLEDDCNV